MDPKSAKQPQTPLSFGIFNKIDQYWKSSESKKNNGFSGQPGR